MTIKILNSTIDNYNKHNLTLKYTEQSLNKNIVKFTLSLFHENKEMFKVNELIYKNDEAYKFLKDGSDKIECVEFMNNYEGIYIYLYYFDKLDKWFVSTKKQINNYEIYKSFKRAVKNQNINLNDLDKKYVYVFNLMSNKFMNYCSNSKNKYDIIEFIKKINIENNEEIYKDNYKSFNDVVYKKFLEDPLFTVKKDINVNDKNYEILYENPDYNVQKNINIDNTINELELRLKYLNHLNSKENNGFLKVKGIKIYCNNGNKKTTLMIDTEIYKYLRNINYNYQKYRIKPIDVLFLSECVKNIVLPNDNNYNTKNKNYVKFIEQVIQNFYYCKHSELIMEFKKYNKIYNDFIKSLKKYYTINDNTNYPKSLIYFYNYIDKNPLDQKYNNDFRYCIKFYCENNLNLFWSLYNGILKLENTDKSSIDSEHCKIQ